MYLSNSGNVGTNCDKGKTTIMMVTDSCPECHAGDLDLSNGAWDKITGNAGPSRFKVNKIGNYKFVHDIFRPIGIILSVLKISCGPPISNFSSKKGPHAGGLR